MHEAPYLPSKTTAATLEQHKLFSRKKPTRLRPSKATSNQHADAASTCQQFFSFFSGRLGHFNLTQFNRDKFKREKL
jgi:hypothetical protein